MTGSFQRALQLRYHGPYPPRATVSADSNLPLAKQAARRRILAWGEVRQAASTSLRAARKHRAIPCVKTFNSYRAGRNILSYAIKNWRYWRGCPD